MKNEDCLWVDDDDDDDDDNVSDVAHPQTIVNVDSQRHFVDGDLSIWYSASYMYRRTA